MVWVDREALKRMVFQNHLLKKMVARSGDEPLKQLLESLEIILLEISNSDSDNDRNDSVKLVQEMLKANDVLFKMRVYTKKENRRLRPTI